jgi:hypothetical protein
MNLSLSGLMTPLTLRVRKLVNAVSCPPHVEAHAVATHLVDQSWVDDVISEFGEDSPFVEARVNARFPQTGTGKVIPYHWAEQLHRMKIILNQPLFALELILHPMVEMNS